jgi:hypothetical protein
VKADDTRPELQDKAEPVLFKARKGLAGLGHRAEPEFREIWGELRSHAPRRLRRRRRRGMDEEVQVERLVCRLAYRRDLLADG